jgi:tetrahydrodipicolinate N-succinyltransferase
MFKQIINSIKKKLIKYLPKLKSNTSYNTNFTIIMKEKKIKRISLDKEDDLNYELLNKFLELIDELVHKSEKSGVQLKINFKESILTCKEKNEMIVLQSIRPKSSDNFDEIAFFNNKPYYLKDFLYDKVMTNADIIELEKTAIMIM